MIYRLLLRLFPREFRARFGDEMTATFEQRRRDARQRGFAALLLFWLRTIADVAHHGREERRGRRHYKGDSTMSGLLQDTRFALHLFKQRPAFAAAAVLTLALGIGVNVAVFSVLNGVLIRWLPFPNADRLVQVSEATAKDGGGFPFNPGNFDDVRRGTTDVFQSIAALRVLDTTLTGVGDAARISSVNTTPELFDVIGVAPMMGRPLTAADAAANARVTVVAYAFWQHELGGDPNVLGREITLDDVRWTVVGVMPRGVAYPSTGAVWLPWAFTTQQITQRNSWFLQAVGRLRPGVTVAQADAAAKHVFESMPPEYFTKDRTAEVVDLREATVSPVRHDLVFVQGVALLVLLIACANLANLLLANATAREQEVAIRASLGATRMRLMRQLLVENTLLSVAGGVIGTGIAALFVPLLLKAYTGPLPGRERIAVSSPELFAALAAAIATTLIFGLVPAVISSRAPWAQLLRSNTRAGGTRRMQLLRAGLVAGEVMMALTLLAGSALLIKSFATLTNQPIGFDSRSVLAAQISIPQGRFSTPEQRRAALASAMDQVTKDPNVEAATFMWPLQFDRALVGLGFQRDPADGSTESMYTSVQFVSPGYLKTLKVALKHGRFFDDTDMMNSPKVAVVNEQFAAKWGKGRQDGTVVGMRLQRGKDEPWTTIVGVVADARVAYNVAPKPLMLLNVNQNNISSPKIAVRTRIDPMHYATRLREIVRGIDPNVPVTAVSTLSGVVGDSVSPKRFNMNLLTGLAVLAVLLSVIGIYGVMVYVVGQRTREIGIRMALGAKPTQVQSLFVRQGLATVSVGIAGGLIGAWFLTTMLKKELFEVAPHDPLPLAAAAVTFLIVGTLACWIPARRAARVNPITVLKVD